MRAETHIGIALASAALLTAWTAPPGLGQVAALVAGSVLPDIDYPYAPAGRLLTLPPSLDPRLGSRGRDHYPWHRKLTHTLAAVLGLLGLAVFYRGGGGWIAWLTLGYLTHLLADTLTPWGVPWLWPLEPWAKRHRWAMIGVESQEERLLAGAAWLVVSLAIAIRLIQGFV